jgi:hypothetical protein
VDDAAAALELALDRGGADLRPTRKNLDKSVADFLSHVENARKMSVLEETDLLYDLEDAAIALEDLQELARGVPDEVMPPRQPRGVKSEEKTAAPGKPTLKRRPEQEEEKKPPH